MAGPCRILLNEVFTFYEEFFEGRELPLKPAPQYRNYINWLQKQDPLPVKLSGVKRWQASPHPLR